MKVSYFELGTQVPDKIIKFYSDVFGWKFSKWEGTKEGAQEYWVIEAGKEDIGINGGMFKSKEGHQVVNTITVANLDESVKIIEQHGGKIVVPKFVVNGIGWIAYFKDVEDNLFGIAQMDSNAK